MKILEENELDRDRFIDENELDSDRFIDGQFCVIGSFFPVSMVQLNLKVAEERANAENSLSRGESGRTI